MNYKRNEDMLCDETSGKLSYNQVLDVLFTEGSLEPDEPVTLELVKDFCRISQDFTDDDAILTALITTARQMQEAYTNTGYINREVTAILNNGNGGVYLPYGPIGEVATIDGTAPVTDDGQIEGVKWKQLMTKGERITVVYQAGFETLPEQYKTALLNTIYYLYDNRAVATDGIGEIAKKILNPLKRG